MYKLIEPVFAMTSMPEESETGNKLVWSSLYIYFVVFFCADLGTLGYSMSLSAPHLWYFQLVLKSISSRHHATKAQTTPPILWKERFPKSNQYQDVWWCARFKAHILPWPNKFRLFSPSCESCGSYFRIRFVSQSQCSPFHIIYVHT
jgi:hypothetical protein